MNSPALLRLPLVVLASLVLLASCGSAEDSAAATTPTVVTDAPIEETPDEETPDEETPDEETPDETPVEETPDEEAADTAEENGTTNDDRTEQEIAVDKLDLMMIQLGISELEDLEDATSCVMDRLESENIEFTGEGTADLIALSACNKTIISQWLPSTNPAVPDALWACTVENIGEWIGGLSIADAEAFFDAASPPEEFIAETADRCNASIEEIAAAF